MSGKTLRKKREQREKRRQAMVNTWKPTENLLKDIEGEYFEGSRQKVCYKGLNGHSRHELVIVMPITDASDDKKSGLYIPLAKCGLSKPSVVDIYQIRALSTSRILEKVGHIRAKDFDKVKTNLALLLEIREQHIPTLKGN
jgi:mRNA-degrading endonuclease toxin of MazEF toxin-antitoxin module